MAPTKKNQNNPANEKQVQSNKKAKQAPAMKEHHTTPFKATREALKQKFRDAFNLKVFNICPDGKKFDGSSPQRIAKGFWMTSS